MPIRKIAGTAAALAAALSIMTPAMAADAPGADIARGAVPAPTPMPDAPPPPRLPDARPAWNGSPPSMGPVPAVMQIDPRTRDIWLTECRRRMAIYYGGDWDDDHGWKRHSPRHRDRDARSMRNDYCEVYFDDYYRHYAQAGYANGQPMMMTRAVAPSTPAAQNCVTEEHVSYVPVRSRHIPRRVYKRVPDKRIPMN